MEKKISCNIINDLLESYVDSLLNENTVEIVENHLLNCKECNRKYIELNNKNKFIKDKSSDKKSSDIWVIRKRIVKSLLFTLLIGFILTTLNVFYMSRELSSNLFELSEYTTIILLSIGMYFIPTMMLYFAILWRVTIENKKTYLVDIIVVFLSINLLIQGIVLFLKFT